MNGSTSFVASGRERPTSMPTCRLPTSGGWYRSRRVERRSWGILRGRFRADGLATSASPPARKALHSHKPSARNCYPCCRLFCYLSSRLLMLYECAQILTSPNPKSTSADLSTTSASNIDDGRTLPVNIVPTRRLRTSGCKMLLKFSAWKRNLEFDQIHTWRSNHQNERVLISFAGPQNPGTPQHVLRHRLIKKALALLSK
jgi:hypothetical protein